jgi:hypothetical protein
MLKRIGEHDLAALFADRADRTTILNWRAGRRNMPAWAIDRVRQRWLSIKQEGDADLGAMVPGPGLKAGARNLAIWRASQNR